MLVHVSMTPGFRLHSHDLCLRVCDGCKGGIRNYSIFQRRDGLLFLYNEIDTAAATVPPLGEIVTSRWFCVFCSNIIG
eukprot:SAG11_NODE_1480_length_4835_cov_3.840794_5_plen_78_part_00